MLFQTLLCAVAMIAGPAAALSIPPLLQASNNNQVQDNQPAQQTCTNYGAYECAFYYPQGQSVTYCNEHGVLSTVKTCQPSEECVKRTESNIAYCYPKAT